MYHTMNLQQDISYVYKIRTKYSNNLDAKTKLNSTGLEYYRTNNIPIQSYKYPVTLTFYMQAVL